ncbi:MAG: substrate-binding domain-containing protein [Acidobacteria bacterium]|nr:substrate-binding domain-containing protein [Acidobacteriota bacterium]
MLGTTTSVGNSGLLDRILPGYTNARVRTLLVGSGRALEMLAAGTADVVISHAPARETAMLKTHPSWRYRKILFNDFVIVGPPGDSADVRGATDAAEAMRRIAGSGATFLSRGDESGTHERERELWSAAGVAPAAQRLVIAGAGMGQTLRIAGSSGAYTLTDRATFEALAGSVTLTILNAGDPRLLNTYAVIADPKNAAGAEFAEWLAQGSGRELIGAEAAAGRIRGFSPWPRDMPASTPDAKPR